MVNHDHHHSSSELDWRVPDSALSVAPGVVRPPSVNPAVEARLRQIRRKKMTFRDYLDGIFSGDRIVLSKAITLLESRKPSDYDLSQQVLNECLPRSGNSYRIGITGVPGAGKSTLIESLGLMLTEQGRKLAVLAIDPSSARSKGSILGDKTRMEMLSGSENAFIRPSPSAGSLGGVARKTRETIILCEAAGYETIFIETVGVGQSETAVHSMVDMFLLLLITGAGDDLQGIKRGVMEMADIVAFNKADGKNARSAQVAAVQCQSALHFFPPDGSGWTPQATTCSATTRQGLPELWEMIDRYFTTIKGSGYFDENRSEQAKYWMLESIHNELERRFFSNPKVANMLPIMEKDVVTNKISSFVAAQNLLAQFFADARAQHFES